ncbi:MAG: TetR/AcrR family transcriptional regulator [Lachnospiraceae bacterium]|nr:TetR/AcrR family transcriptional regulator [Lachnospiraceae bacterium]
MARKAVLTGGKRDEILDVAMHLFFEHGYEATSVRMIMNEVGGEIGMFYHYFKSKDMLFDRVVDRFFEKYREQFAELIRSSVNPSDLIEKLMPLYERSMGEFGQIQGNMHWTVQIAMHERTLMELRPLIASVIEKWNIKSKRPADIIAGQLLYGISATIHSPEFEKMDPADKKECIMSFMGRVLEGAQD